MHYNVMLTGSTGWIGRNVLEMLHGKANIITSIREMQNIDSGDWTLIHCAYVTKDRENDPDYIRINSDLAYAIRGIMLKAKPKSILFPSSGAVYRKGDLYGVMKSIHEDDFSNTAKKIDAKIIIPRIFNLSGKYINKLTMYALSDLAIQALKGNTIEVKSPNSMRSYVHVQDLLELCFNLLGDWRIPKELIFDTGYEDTDMANLAYCVANSAGNIAPLYRLGSEPATNYMGEKRHIIDLFKHYGMKPKKLIEQTNDTVEYIRGIL